MLIFGLLVAFIICVHAWNTHGFHKLHRNPRLHTSLFATADALTDLKSWTVKDLQEECRNRGYKVKGKKEELITRLQGPAPSKFQSMLVEELRAECKLRSLQTSGRRNELISRIEDWEAKEAAKLRPPPPAGTGFVLS